MLGGETSGHILTLDHTTTGDGLITALQVLSIMKQTGRSLAELAAGMDKLPAGAAQRARWRAASIRQRCPALPQRCAASRSNWQGEGRVVLRASGTEPVIRVMVEGRDAAEVRACADDACRGSQGGGPAGDRAELRARHGAIAGGQAAWLSSARPKRRGTVLRHRPSGARQDHATGPSLSHATQLVAGNWKMHGSRAENAPLVEAIAGGPESRERRLRGLPAVRLSG